MPGPHLLAGHSASGLPDLPPARSRLAAPWQRNLRMLAFNQSRSFKRGLEKAIGSAGLDLKALSTSCLWTRGCETIPVSKDRKAGDSLRESKPPDSIPSGQQRYL